MSEDSGLVCISLMCRVATDSYRVRLRSLKESVKRPFARNRRFNDARSRVDGLEKRAVVL